MGTSDDNIESVDWVSSKLFESENTIRRSRRSSILTNEQLPQVIEDTILSPPSQTSRLQNYDTRNEDQEDDYADPLNVISGENIYNEPISQYKDELEKKTICF